MGVLLFLAATALVGMRIALVVTLVAYGYLYAIASAFRRHDGAIA